MSAPAVNKSNKSVISFRSIISINCESPLSEPLRPEPFASAYTFVWQHKRRVPASVDARAVTLDSAPCAGWKVDQVRAAQAYMLISMPTGSSTIIGAFQDIIYSSWFQSEFYCSSRRR
jgi:hypothetical protein